jgi:hypothetical protein
MVDALAERRIKKLQIEASLRCQLRCPACSNGVQTKQRPRPHVMPVGIFERLLDSLTAEGYDVREVEYCGQGEPLLHPRFPSLAAAARRRYPQAVQRVITNGNVDYAKSTGRQGIDELFVSCDGARQDSYVKYRIGGDIERAHRFMRDTPGMDNGIGQRVVWKYILFEFNDTTEEVEQAQHLAQEFGVDVLLFVFTHSRFKSERWNAANASDFPVLYPNVTTSATPVQDRGAVALTAVGDWIAPRLRRAPELFSIDRLAVCMGQLECTGWAWLGDRTADSVEIALDGRPIGELRSGYPRHDVVGAHPHVTSTSGFTGRVPVDLPAAGEHRIELTFKAGNRRALQLRRRYQFGSKE